MATTKSSTVTAAPGATPAAAFFDIPLALITVAGQIRSRIDQEGEAIAKPPKRCHPRAGGGPEILEKIGFPLSRE